jgi:hypothetical protein
MVESRYMNSKSVPICWSFRIWKWRELRELWELWELWELGGAECRGGVGWRCPWASVHAVFPNPSPGLQHFITQTKNHSVGSGADCQVCWGFCGLAGRGRETISGVANSRTESMLPVPVASVVFSCLHDKCWDLMIRSGLAGYFRRRTSFRETSAGYPRPKTADGSRVLRRTI